jgi:hypothetical protein
MLVMAAAMAMVATMSIASIEVVAVLIAVIAFMTVSRILVCIGAVGARILLALRDASAHARTCCSAYSGTQHSATLTAN